MPAQSNASHIILMQANSAFRNGRLAEASRLARTVLQGAPRQFDALRLLGQIEGSAGRLQNALAMFDQALKQQPQSAAAMNDRGKALLQMRRFDEAISTFDRVIALRPDMAEAYFNRGNAVIFRGREQASRRDFDDALASYDRALAIQPDWDVALFNRGNALADLGRYDEALVDFDSVIARSPRNVAARLSRADTLQLMAHFDAALDSYGEATSLDPSLAGAHVKRAALLLRLGRWSEGWREMEWRLRSPDWPKRATAVPAWDGRVASGKRLLLHAEQGFGDTMQFARFARDLSAQGVDVTIEVHPRLARLMQSLAGVKVAARATAASAVDAEAPLMSVPAILKFDEAVGTGSPLPYLGAEPQHTRRLLARLPSKGIRIGIAWQGNPESSLDRGRSIPVSAFLPLAAIPGVTLISLQKYAGTEQLSALGGAHPIVTLGDDIDGDGDAFIDTAAVMMHLDLIVSSDTAVAHLAGALGRPLWIALQHVPDWRWLVDRDDTPWYPGARLFRQARRGDWSDVFQRIESELRGILPSIRPKSGDA